MAERRGVAPSGIQGPLRGVRIVELAGIGPVPFAGMLLADMGAEILLVESPIAREAQMPLPSDSDPLFRGRTRLTLDLKADADRERLLEIVATADVLLEGYRPGVMERLGLGPEACLRRVPRLVYGRMTGWGQSGPLAHSAGHDPNYIALIGALYSMGYPDRPPTPPLNIVGDFAGGSLYLVMGVLAALMHARATGEGQVVDAAMIDGAASLMTMVYAMHSAGAWSAERGTNIMDGSCPFGACYATSDGGFMAVCALEGKFFRELVQRLGLDVASLPKQWDRARWPEMQARFAEVFATRTREEWAAIFADSDACATPVLSIAEAPHHPHNVARNVFIGDNKLPAPAPRFSRTPSAHAPQQQGSAADLLKRWGVTQESE